MTVYAGGLAKAQNRPGAEDQYEGCRASFDGLVETLKGAAISRGLNDDQLKTNPGYQSAIAGVDTSCRAFLTTVLSASGQDAEAIKAEVIKLGEGGAPGHVAANAAQGDPIASLVEGGLVGLVEVGIRVADYYNKREDLILNALISIFEGYRLPAWDQLQKR